MPSKYAMTQGFMEDENVACRDLGKVAFERAVICFGTSQLEHTTCLPVVSNRARDSFSNVPIRACDGDIMTGACDHNRQDHSRFYK